MRKVIAVAMVAGLILGAASAVSAQEWSIGVGGVFSNNFGGGFKGDVMSIVADTMLVRVMPKFVSVKTAHQHEIRKTEIIDMVEDEPPLRVVVYDTVWWSFTGDSGLVGERTDSLVTLNRKVPNTREMFTPHYSVGGGVFFASKYAEASVGLVYMGGTWKSTVVGMNPRESIYKIERTVTDTVRSSITVGADTTITVTYDSIRVINDRPMGTTSVSMNSEWEQNMSALNVNIGLWLKYPYDVSEAVKLFPMAGVEYEICTIITRDIRFLGANRWSRTWFKAGAGGDFNLSERVYLHPVVLYGIGWKNSTERSLVKEAGALADTKISHGLTARIGIGYRFEAD
ncbi:MAG: hypothetical protein LBB74_02850 [Chitinispirillales bacterium]|nr:hypothetical protein [Chitinispirillales bacterium]